MAIIALSSGSYGSNVTFLDGVAILSASRHDMNGSLINYIYFTSEAVDYLILKSFMHFYIIFVNIIDGSFINYVLFASEAVQHFI